MNTDILRIPAIFVPVLLLAACASRPHEEPWLEPSPPVVPVAAPAAAGTIYRANTDIRLFEDLRAARVGDILTVQLIEETSASKSANTSTSKSTEATLANPNVFGRPVTRNGIPLLGGTLDGETTFDGAGSSNQSNSLEGDITVTVVERYPNGNLRIRGEKWVTLNQGREFIRLSGIIRPYDVGPDNTVASARIADAQITYSSRGALAAANRMGLFARFFNSLLSGY